MTDYFFWQMFWHHSGRQIFPLNPSEMVWRKTRFFIAFSLPRCGRLNRGNSSPLGFICMAFFSGWLDIVNKLYNLCLIAQHKTVLYFRSNIDWSLNCSMPKTVATTFIMEQFSWVQPLITPKKLGSLSSTLRVHLYGWNIPGTVGWNHCWPKLPGGSENRHISLNANIWLRWEIKFWNEFQKLQSLILSVSWELIESDISYLIGCWYYFIQGL